MIKTRNSYKRSTSLDTNNVKKKRLDQEVDNHDDNDEDLDDTDADSDYEPVASESDSDEIESKFFNKDSKVTNSKIKSIAETAPSTSKQSPKKNVFMGRNFESDSSSDEFEKAPFSLDDLGGFKKIGNDLTVADKSDSDAGKSDEDGSTKENDYFDFTQIIQRQEIYKSITDKKINVDKATSKPSLNDSKRLKNESANKEYIRKKCKRFKSTTSDKSTEDLNVMDLLKLGEGNTNDKHNDDEDYGDEFKPDIKEEEKPRDIQVTIELPGLERRKENKKSDVEAAIKRRFNLIKRQNQVFAHKVHILCWIAHGNYLNDIINTQDLMALALSLIPAKHCYPPKRCDLNYLEKLVQWFINKVKVVDPYGFKSKNNLLKSLEDQFTNQAAYSIKDLALMFVCMVRALGLTARLMLNLIPVPLKPPINELCVINITSNKKTTDNNSDKSHGKRNKSKTSQTGCTDKSNDKSKGSKAEEKDRASKYFDETSSSTTRKANDTTKKGKRPVKSEYFKDKVGDQKEQSLIPVGTETTTTPKRRQSRGKSVPPTKSEPTDTTKVESKRPRRSVCNKKQSSDTSKTSKSINLVESLDSSSETDDDVFVPKTKKRSAGMKKASNDKDEKIDRRIFSSDEDESCSKNKVKTTVDVWAEVFLEAEEKWICVDLIRGKIHCTDLLYCSAARPVTYVLGWENECYVKDLTCRYVPHWMTVTRKQRVDPEWWDETIRPYLPPNNARNREEDEDLDNQMADQSLPTSVGDFKNHPMYALKRHLLKFQAIYPPDAPTVGFIKGEAVYSRLCVVELHTRESWIKEAKLVKIGEEPYKIVKARPKYDKMTGTVIKDLPLNLYGHWQVSDYIPPPAVDGKVPRNEYGNVELYKPCMLPLGTVHLQLPGLNRVAKKLDIDCAPAVVGWDFHSGGSHPILDGFIVCEEFKELLLDAWNKEIDESAKRAKDKIEQRVYGNWRRIIKGLLIREKLKLRYGFEEVPKEAPQEAKSKKKHHSSRKCGKK